MKYIIQPVVNHTNEKILNYICSQIKLDQVILSDYNIWNKKVCTLPLPGEYVVDNTKIVISDIDTFGTSQQGPYRKLNMTLETDNIDEFLNNVEEYNYTFEFVKNKTLILERANHSNDWKVCNTIKKRSMENIHLPINIVEPFLKDLKNFFSQENKDKYDFLDIPKTRIYMFYGPPGTGKTTLIHSIASKLNKHLALLDFDQEMDDHDLNEYVNCIPKDTLVAMEDIDSLFVERKVNDTVRCPITFSGLINMLDGIRQHDNLVFFLTTNFINQLDPALKRRVDYFIKFDYCKKSEMLSMFKKFFPDETEDIFENIYDKVLKNKNITPNILQKYFLKYGATYDSIDPEFFTEKINCENIYL